MTKAIIGKKIGMTQIFDEAGKVVPVTVIEAGPCVVVQKKTTENDGYEAVQLGFGDVTPKHINKPEQGDVIDVAGVSKGKSFTGAIKRHNQHRLKETHGSGPVARQAGSMGACSSPSRIFKGKGMAGHMGAENVTVQNLVVVKVDVENNLIAVRGAVPGPKGGVVTIVNAVKA